MIAKWSSACFCSALMTYRLDAPFWGVVLISLLAVACVGCFSLAAHYSGGAPMVSSAE